MSVDLRPCPDGAARRVRPDAGPGAPPGRVAAAAARPPPRFPTIPGSPSRSAAWSSAARWTRRASDSASLVAAHQRRASRIAYQYLRDAVRSRRSRAGRVRQGVRATSPRIARRGRSRSGSRGFSSTAVSIGARRAAGAIAGSSRRRSRGADEARVSQPRRADANPEAAPAGARAPARGWPRRSIGSTDGSGRSSCCVTTATARRARSA